MLFRGADAIQKSLSSSINNEETSSIPSLSQQYRPSILASISIVFVAGPPQSNGRKNSGVCVCIERRTVEEMKHAGPRSGISICVSGKDKVRQCRNLLQLVNDLEPKCAQS